MNDPSDPMLQRFFARYAEAFNAFDLGALVGSFHSPCLMINQDVVTLLADPAALRASLAALLEHHRAQSFGAATIDELSTRSLGAGLWLATVDWQTTRTDGSPLWRFANTYNLVREADGPRIVVSTTHAQRS